MNMSVDKKKNSESLQALLNAQKKAYQLAPSPLVQQRISQLIQLKTALLTYQDQLVTALEQDYGQR
ncbi:MAG: coniferyl-aldehyde dehydrogenase, partial [Alteromonadaceae bacterium]